MALAWILWCGLHSVLIHPPVEERLTAAFGRRREMYRLLYNLIALLTLVPVGFFYVAADATPLFSWPAWLKPLQWLCWCVVAAVTYAAARVYDMSHFLGFRQLHSTRTNSAAVPESDDAGLVVVGILRFSRHPWYLAGLLLLWSRDLFLRDLVTNSLLTVYLLVGIILEERKLLRQFGAAYEAYRQQVPMLWGIRFWRSRP